MKVTPLAIPDVLMIEPRVFKDERGCFFESFNARRFQQRTGIAPVFVQDNHSSSVKGVLHGLHYQVRQAQGKLVRVVKGSVFDVAVDLRKTSNSFGQWVGIELSAENRRQVWIPPGFAHGYLVLSEKADFVYKVTDYYAPEFERSIAWDDQRLGVQWPLALNAIGPPLLSPKDADALPFSPDSF